MNSKTLPHDTPVITDLRCHSESHFSSVICQTLLHKTQGLRQDFEVVSGVSPADKGQFWVESCTLR